MVMQMYRFTNLLNEYLLIESWLLDDWIKTDKVDIHGEKLYTTRYGFDGRKGYYYTRRIAIEFGLEHRDITRSRMLWMLRREYV